MVREGPTWNHRIKITNTSCLQLLALPDAQCCCDGQCQDEQDAQNHRDYDGVPLQEEQGCYQC